MDSFKLIYKDQEFIEKPRLESFEKDQASLVIYQDTMEAFLSFSFEIGLVDKKIAERLAEGICKNGFFLQNGKQIGHGCKLIISDKL